ncbi:restriction endonuclease subunit S [Micromonospora sp. Mcm103]|uniref:restriction endonuclease subunit S n=1 Tax=Micromonospora sp. Mcm103 TaxID=2926015 RepID=UPI0021C844B0|nr:restriction endonuclease subunit S [Micromonospora sp. Mcm103]
MSEWRESTLGDEIDLVYGKALPAHARVEGKVGVFGSNGLVGNHDEALVDGPGIVVGRKGSVGAVAYSESGFWPIDTTYYVENKGGLSWRYLYFLLRSSGLTGLNSHSTVPGLNRADVYSIPVRIPPRDVQDDIAHVLDYISYAEELEVKALRNGEELMRSVAQAVFPAGDPNDSSGWVYERIGDNHNVTSGGTPSRTVADYWVGGTIPWVKTTEINYSVITETSERITKRGLDESAAKILPAGTVLLAMYGQGVTRGKVAVLGIDAATNQACAAIRPASDAVDPRYLYHYLAHQYEDLRQRAHGGQQQNLNLDIVRDFPISYPSDRTEQARIVEILDAIEDKIATHRQRKLVLRRLVVSLTHRLVREDISLDDLDLFALPVAQEQLEEAFA